MADLSKLVNELSDLTVLEAAKLAKILEEKWGVERGTVVQEFISEDDLNTFEGWLRYQAGDAATIPPDQLAMLRDAFDRAKERTLATPKVGLMKLQSVPRSTSVRSSDMRRLRSLANAVGPAFPEGRVFCHGAARRPGLERSHKLPPRRHAAHEELRPNAPIGKAPAFGGKVPGNGAPRKFHGARSEKGRGDLRPDRLFWSCQSCAWCVGSAQGRSGS